MSNFSKTKDSVNTLLTISSMYNSLTRTEQKIADIIKKDPEFVVYASLTDLAERAGVGDTSVLRLCRHLGFRGYQEFKLSLAQDLVTPIKSVHSKIDEGDSLVTIANKITTDNKASLENTLALLSMGELQKTIDAITNANKIYFMGVGSSANTAADAKYRFMRLGFNTELLTDSHVMAMSAILMNKQDVVFAVSTSGSTKDLVDAVRIAKQNDVFFVCLTSHAKSPITKYADAILLTFSKETPQQGGAFASKITQIHVLDILSTAMAIHNKEKSYKAIELTSKSVSDKLY